MIIDFSRIDFKEYPTLLLKSADGTPIQILASAYNIKGEFCFNETSTIEFDLPAFVDGEPTPHYDDVSGLKIIDMIGYGQFILINPDTDSDGIREVKHCKAYSIEYELTYKKLSLPEDTYNFYDPVAPSETIVGIIMSYLPSWSIGTVSTDLIGKYRTFSEDDVNVYNFIKSTLQETYGCIFDFDTYNRVINVRSTMETAATEPVYLSTDNLAKDIGIEEQTEDIKTVLDVNGADGVDIRSVNPTGGNKIYNIDYFLNDAGITSALRARWNAWKKDCADEQDNYYNLSVQSISLTSAILIKQNELNEKRSIDLADLYNLQSVLAALIPSLNPSSSEYITQNQRLQQTNTDIAAMELALYGIELDIENLETQKNIIQNQLSTISTRLNLKNYFTVQEYEVLDRYFIEDSISESSFVFREAGAYTNTGKYKHGSTGLISFDNCTLTVTELPITGEENEFLVLYTVAGGDMDFTSGEYEVKSNNINAVLQYNTKTKALIVSAYLSKGTETDDDDDDLFNSATFTVSSTSDYRPSYDPEHPDFVMATAGNLDSYFTKEISDFEKHSIEWDLYRYGISCLNKLSYPSYTFSINSSNFFMLDEYISFVNKIKLGSKVYVSLENGDGVKTPIFIGASIDFDSKSLDLQFSDSYSSYDNEFSLVDILDQSVSMGKNVDTKRFGYNAFIDSGASTQVKEFMESALDVAKNTVLSSSGMAVSWDGSGIRCRKYTPEDPMGGFDPEQIAIVNNSIVFTDDAWHTAKMAIGKIFTNGLYAYKKTTDDHYIPEHTYYTDIYGTKWNGRQEDWTSALYEKYSNPGAYGVAAPYIVGNLIAGNNLTIESVKPDGQHMAFKVDANGAVLYNSQFEIVRDSNNHILLDPDIGIAIGTYPLIDPDTGEIKNNNLKFWADPDGDLHLKGTLEAVGGVFTGELSAATGSFSGTITASEFKNSKGQSMFDQDKEKWDPDYLELKGLVVENDSGDTTFSISSNGNVTMIGSLTAGSSISGSIIKGSEFHDSSDYYAVKFSEWGDFTYYKIGDDTHLDQNVFQLYNGVTDITVKLFDNDILFFSNVSDVCRPQGIWNFGDTTIQGLGVVPCFG